MSIGHHTVYVGIHVPKSYRRRRRHRRRSNHKEKRERVTEGVSDKSDTENADETAPSILKPLSESSRHGHFPEGLLFGQRCLLLCHLTLWPLSSAPLVSVAFPLLVSLKAVWNLFSSYLELWQICQWKKTSFPSVLTWFLVIIVSLWLLSYLYVASLALDQFSWFIFVCLLALWLWLIMLVSEGEVFLTLLWHHVVKEPPSPLPSPLNRVWGQCDF